MVENDDDDEEFSGKRVFNQRDFSDAYHQLVLNEEQVAHNNHDASWSLMESARIWIEAYTSNIVAYNRASNFFNPQPKPRLQELTTSSFINTRSESASTRIRLPVANS